MSSDQKLAATPIVGGLFQDIHDYMMGQLRVEDFKQGENRIAAIWLYGFGLGAMLISFLLFVANIGIPGHFVLETLAVGMASTISGTSVGTRFLTPVMVGLPLVILVNAAIQSCLSASRGEVMAAILHISPATILSVLCATIGGSKLAAIALMFVNLSVFAGLHLYCPCDGHPTLYIQVGTLVLLTFVAMSWVIIARGLYERLLDKLHQARDRAEEASRFKSLYVATVSHDIRTPLGGIVGLSQLLLESPLSAVQREWASSLHDGGRMLLQLASQVLDYTRIEAGRLDLILEPFDLYELVAELVRVCGVVAKPSVDLVSRVAPDVPRVVVGDALRLRQVLSNILSNASKYTAHGFVAMEVELDKESTDSNSAGPQQLQDADEDASTRMGIRRFSRSLLRRLGENDNAAARSNLSSASASAPESPNTSRATSPATVGSDGGSGSGNGNGGDDVVRLRISVRDTGHGIQPEQLRTLFEPFRRGDGGKRRSSGAGLGLSIAQRLVKRMGGTINIDSTVGVGSLFTVYLSLQRHAGPPPPPQTPIVVPASEVASTAPKLASTTTSACVDADLETAHVFVLSDNVGARGVYARALMDRKATVTELALTPSPEQLAAVPDLSPDEYTVSQAIGQMRADAYGQVVALTDGRLGTALRQAMQQANLTPRVIELQHFSRLGQLDVENHYQVFVSGEQTVHATLGRHNMVHIVAKPVCGTALCAAVASVLRRRSSMTSGHAEAEVAVVSQPQPQPQVNLASPNECMPPVPAPAAQASPKRPVSVPSPKHTTRKVPSVQQQQQQASKPGSVVDGEEPPSPPLVLLVEDSRVNQIVVRALLTRLGYGVETVASGRDAVTLVQRAGEGAFCAVLMDVFLPELDGYAATRAIREHERTQGWHRRLPIIALTASVDSEAERQKCLESGMNDFMTKPVTSAALRDKLSAQIGIASND